MKVEILFKDKSTLTIENVKRVTNASTNIEKDWLYIYTNYDIPGKPSIRYPMEKIICVDVKSE